MRTPIEFELLYKPLLAFRLKLLTKKLQKMKLWEFDIHLSDEERDKEWHKEKEFTEQWKKDAQFWGITWTWSIMWVSELWIKDDKMYLIPNWMGVYEVIDSDLHNLKKLKCQSKSEITRN